MRVLAALLVVQAVVLSGCCLRNPFATNDLRLEPTEAEMKAALLDGFPIGSTRDHVLCELKWRSARYLPGQTSDSDDQQDLPIVEVWIAPKPPPPTPGKFVNWVESQMVASFHFDGDDLLAKIDVRSDVEGDQFYIPYEFEITADN